MNIFGITRIIPEFNDVMDTLFKEGSEILSYSNKLDLIRMSQWVKYMSYQIDSISNNYDAWNVSNLNHLIDSASDCKQFSLSWSNITV